MPETDAVSARSRALGKAALFEGLDEDDLDAFGRLARPASFAMGAVIFHKGDHSHGLYVIERGRVKISAGSADGQEIVLNLLGPGAVFGEIALIDGGERTADAVAVEPVNLLVLDRRDLTPLLERRPAIALKMLVALTARLRWMSDRFEDALFLELPARLAKRLLFLAEHFGLDTARGRRLTVALPQRELARHMSVTRETVNRLLQEWRGEGLIELDRGVLILKDLDRLQAIAAG